MGFRPRFRATRQTKAVDRDAYPRPPPDGASTDLRPRPPVVAVLGHVDHGKTTLLDSLKSTRMVDSEFGGITQHLSAFCVPLSTLLTRHAGTENSSSSKEEDDESKQQFVTFLDTPGHAAFAAVRERGAYATDIVVLVVAADDGVMPQTVESIKFAKEAGTPIVVAINKIDKKGIDVSRVIEGLANHDVLVEALGGDVQAVEISALKRLNLSLLLETILTQAEMMQLEADFDGPAEAVVLESHVEHGLGKVAICLATRGLLKRTPSSGPLVAGEAICTPRLLFNDVGHPMDRLGPGLVAKVAGWKELPTAGSLLLEVESMSRANEVVRYRRQQRLQVKAERDQQAYQQRMAPYFAEYGAFLEQRAKLSRSDRGSFRKQNRNNLHNLQQATVSGSDDRQHIVLTIKTDVQGSLDAIQHLLSSCPSEECAIDLSCCGIGPLKESEVEQAASSGSSILLFNVSSLPGTQQLADSLAIPVASFNIIYRLAEHVRDLVNSRLAPSIVEQVIGEAEILQRFDVKDIPPGGGRPQKIPVAGCRCIRGQLLADDPKPKHFSSLELLGEPMTTHYRIIRPSADGTPLNLVDRAACFSLKHEKTPVEVIRKGMECGLVLTDTPVQSSGSSSSAAVTPMLISTWQPGDRLQCYLLVKQTRQIEWEFEGKPIDSDSVSVHEE